MDEIKKKIQKQLQKDYVLSFNQSESTWKEEETLGGGPAKASSGNFSMMISSSAENEVLYKNISKKTYRQTQDLMGSLYLIEDELPVYNWKITTERKKIGDFNCQKAVHSEVIESKTFSTEMEDMEISKDTVETVVWFTTEIPVSTGPRNTYGLPGLILEMQKKSQRLLCTKVILNPDEEITIEVPSKGKKVSKDEYKEISEKKFQKMMEQYRGKGSGETIEIRIDG
jgi:GLPGLI family protein